jgi:ABC-type Fe3+-citrate transport system substrate-binding protein
MIFIPKAKSKTNKKLKQTKQKLNNTKQKLKKIRTKILALGRDHHFAQQSVVGYTFKE